MTEVFTAPEPTSAEARVRRDRWNRPIIRQADGSEVAYTRMTTLCKMIEDTHNLEKWKRRNVILGLVERPDLLLSARAHRDDKDQLNRISEDAQEAAKAKAKATIGTALHKLTEDADRGVIDAALPPEYIAILAAYQRLTAGMEMLGTEEFRVLDRLKVAGTADRRVRLNGQVYIFDTKTGSIELGALTIAMQLAGYANGCRYDVDTGARLDDGPDAPSLDRGIVCHLPQDGSPAGLYWVDLCNGIASLELASRIHAARKVKATDLLETLRLDDSAIESVDPLIAAIEAAESYEQLGALWQANAAVWTETHTRIAARRKAELA